MSAAARNAESVRSAGHYQPHRPEQTLLYQIVEEYYPAFTAHLAEQGRELPSYVQREFEDYLRCGRLEHGFLRVRCESYRAEHLVDKVIPEQPVRQWMLGFPYPLRFLLPPGRQSRAKC